MITIIASSFRCLVRLLTFEMGMDTLLLFKTKSMFILPKNENSKFYKNFIKVKMQINLSKKKKIVNIKFGQALIFSHQ